MIIDLVSSLGGLIVPPVFDFIKKKFLKSDNDTAEATLNTLATTKPEVMGEFITANATLLDSKIKFFNRDVIGAPRQWIVDLRAAIRPVFVVVCTGIFVYSVVYKLQLDSSLKAFIELNISSWFGNRITK